MAGMDEEQLAQIAKSLVASGKGLLAADESNASCEKRFKAVGVACTEDTRQEYRQLLLTAPDAEQILSGVILFDETFWQSTDSGQVFREYLKNHHVMPGIKVDKGLVDLPGFQNEKVTQGLDGLPERMVTYAGAGAKFAKWRAVITIGDGIPTDECIGANVYTHSSDDCEQAMVRTFDVLFQTLSAFRVYLPGVILKTSMVLPGKDSGTSINYDEVADRTVRVLHEHVPTDLGGVVFLSGGQSSKDALINLNRIAQRGPYPWGVTFSYSRALQDPVLKSWAKERKAVHDIQELFSHQLQLASSASKGELDESQLTEDVAASHSQDI
jgi:fructose-bisphosphate aldolase class I